jgi:hypothetical protein
MKAIVRYLNETDELQGKFELQGGFTSLDDLKKAYKGYTNVVPTAEQVKE